MSFYLMQMLNGISYGMLLFLLASGLSLIYGLMKILNLTHGSFYLLGAYIGVYVSLVTGSFLLAIVASSCAVAIIGVAMERFILRRIPHQELQQTLLTFGFLFIFADIALMIWGGSPQSIERPEILEGAVQLGSFFYPIYRLALIAIGLVVAIALWILIEYTQIGAMLRAGVDDEETARGLGINVSLLFTLVFALGAFLAAMGGVLAGPMLGVYPGADYEIMLLGFVVVIIGGLGSLGGAFVASIAIGVIDTMGKVFFPDFALFTVFAPMAIVLAIRPRGLFGKE